MDKLSLHETFPDIEFLGTAEKARQLLKEQGFIPVAIEIQSDNEMESSLFMAKGYSIRLFLEWRSDTDFFKNIRCVLTGTLKRGGHSFLEYFLLTH